MKFNHNTLPALALSGSVVLTGCSASFEKPDFSQSDTALDPHTIEDYDPTCSIGIQSTIRDDGTVVVKSPDGTPYYGKRGAQCATGDVATELSPSEIGAFNQEVLEARDEWSDLARRVIKLATSREEENGKPSEDVPALEYGRFEPVANLDFHAKGGPADPNSYQNYWPGERCSVESWGMTVVPLGDISDPSSDELLNIFRVNQRSRATNCDLGDILVADPDGSNHDVDTPHQWVDVDPLDKAYKQ